MNDRYDGSQFIEQDPSENMGGKNLFDRRLKSYINNDNYLKIQTDALWDSTPPTTRKRFSKIPIDLDKSYGVEEQGNNYQISNSESMVFNFMDYYDDLINDESTDLELHNNNGTKTITLPKTTTTEEDNSTQGIGPWGNTYVSNESWNVSFDPAVNYFLRPYFLTDPDHEEIPGVCRAQTFKAKTTGYLNSVNLRLGGGSDYGCDIILATCEKVTIKRGRKKGTAFYPPSMSKLKKHILDRIHVNWKLDRIEMRNFQFPKKPHVVAGIHYCIIVKSSLSPYSKSFRLGGWSDHCWKTKKPATVEKYKDGEAFYSKDNGYNWMLHGIPNKRLKYSQGKHPPILFNFECYIETSHEEFDTKEYLLYSKPLHVNPVENATLNIDCQQEGGVCEYQIYDDISNTWQDFNPDTNSITYSGAEKPTFLILRVALTRGADPTKSPIIYRLALTVNTEKAKKGILRTVPYVPDTKGLLSASMYSKLKAPIEANYNNNWGYVDVVKDTTIKESYNFIFFDDIPRTHLGLSKGQLDEIQAIINLPEETPEEITKKEDYINNYILNNSNIINQIFNKNVLICEELLLKKSGPDYVRKGINLKGSVAYPIISCNFQPVTFDSDKGDGGTEDLTNRQYMEFLNYNLDYDEDYLYFKEDMRNTIANTGGILEVEYNPCFVSDLLNHDMEHGFNLDIGAETRIVSNPAEDNTIVLRMDAVDPVRELTITREDPQEGGLPPEIREIELEEDKHFIVDYPNKTVRINGFKLQNRDLITVKYTPNLRDEKISLVYRLKRENVGDNVVALPYWIETKT